MCCLTARCLFLQPEAMQCKCFPPKFLSKVLKVCMLRNNTVCVCGCLDAVDFNFEIFVPSIDGKKMIIAHTVFHMASGKHVHCQWYADTLDFCRFYSQFFCVCALVEFGHKKHTWLVEGKLMIWLQIRALVAT